MNNSVKIHTLFIACAISLSACNNSETTTESRTDSTSTEIKNDVREVAQDVKDAMNGNQDSNFIVKAALNNMTEMQVLQAGLDDGSSKELKGHARMMMADHKKMGTAVMAYAEKKGYLLPTSDEGKGDEQVREFAKKSKGSEWDKVWIKRVEQSHEDMIDMFEKGNNNVNDAELKAWIQQSLPTLRAHEDMMKGMEDKMN